MDDVILYLFLLFTLSSFDFLFTCEFLSKRTLSEILGDFDLQFEVPCNKKGCQKKASPLFPVKVIFSRLIFFYFL